MVRDWPVASQWPKPTHEAKKTNIVNWATPFQAKVPARLSPSFWPMPTSRSWMATSKAIRTTMNLMNQRAKSLGHLGTR